ncbi:carboxymuconolactone decarboxylase family protein [Microbacterium sp. NPDC079176]|uniref:carboxymuconolactone decarboxylase family protein n=1 Tax=Microbacterium sp. NPDC079176 TaxID=3154768 RepID=UPI0034280DDF
MTERGSAADQMLGGFADKLVSLTDEVLFADVWARPDLAARDRSLITIAALVAGGNTEQLPFHLNLGAQNGLTEKEMVEAITHLAFYTGWPRAMSAIASAKGTFHSDESAEGEPK